MSKLVTLDFKAIIKATYSKGKKVLFVLILIMKSKN